MSVLNSLVLDHFYISLPQEKFDQYQEFFSLLDSIHQSVVTDSDSWEGLYSYSRIRDYFEILKDRREGGLGIGLSPVGLVNVNVKNIITEQSYLEWKCDTRYFANKEPWFDWYSLGDYMDSKHNFFNIWIMDYYKSHVDYFKRPTRKKIDSFVSLEMRLGADRINEIRRLLGFSDYLKVSTSNEIEISIPRRDGWEFNIKISLVKGNAKFTPLRLNLSLYGMSKSSLSKIREYDFAVLEQNLLTISF